MPTSEDRVRRLEEERGHNTETWQAAQWLFRTHSCPPPQPQTPAPRVCSCSACGSTPTNSRGPQRAREHLRRAKATKYVCRTGCQVRGSAVCAAHVTGAGRIRTPLSRGARQEEVAPVEYGARHGSVSRGLWCPLPAHVSRSLTRLVSCAILCGGGAPLHRPDHGRVQGRGEPCRGPAGGGVRQGCGWV